MQYINKIIRDRQIDKYYLVLIAGKFPNNFHSSKPLEKIYNEKYERAQVQTSSKGKLSHTDARNIQSRTHPILGEISLVKVKIETGRMHQIRVHLADEGYPVLGDIIYGNAGVNKKLLQQCKIKRQLLHCWQYSFDDSIQKKKRSRQAPLPEEFRQLGTSLSY